MSTHEDVRFYWLNTEMVGILRQLKSTITETEISQTCTQRDMLSLMGEIRGYCNIATCNILQVHVYMSQAFYPDTNARHYKLTL